MAMMGSNSQLHHAGLHNQDITIMAMAPQTRSFCYVSDLVEAIHNVMFCDDPTPFNVGNPDEYTVKEAARRLLIIWLSI